MKGTDQLISPASIMKRENSPKVVKQYLGSNENNVEKIQARTGI